MIPRKPQRGLSNRSEAQVVLPPFLVTGAWATSEKKRRFLLFSLLNCCNPRQAEWLHCQATTSAAALKGNGIRFLAQCQVDAAQRHVLTQSSKNTVDIVMSIRTEYRMAGS